MALDIASKYPGKSNAATAAYPFGSARNITTPGDGTGTPLEEAWLNDLFGFQQALLSAAGLTPSGSPDEVGASQYLQAAGKLFNREYASVSALTSAADAGEVAVGALVKTVAYYDGWAASLLIPRGGNVYALLDSGAPGSRPPEDGGAIIHVAGGSGGLFLFGLFPGGVYVDQFGAKGDGATPDQQKIQAAIDHFYDSAAPGEVLFSGGVTYLINSYFIPRPLVSLRGVGSKPTIKSNTVIGGGYGDIMLPGNFHPDFTEDFTYYPAVSPTSKTRTLTFTGNGGQFSEGDQVFIASTKKGLTGTFAIPLYGWLNIVEDVSGDDVTFRYPIDYVISVEAAVLKNETCRDSRGAFFYQDATVSNLRFESAGGWVSDSATLDVDFVDIEVSGTRGIYGNTFQKTRWLDSKFWFSSGMGEQSHNSLDTLSDNCEFTYTGVPGTATASGVSLQEYARNIFFTNYKIFASSYASGNHIIRTINSRNVKFIDGYADVQGSSGISLIQLGDADATRQDADFVVSDNIVDNLTMNAETCGRFALVYCAEHTTNNGVINSTLNGAPVAGECVRIQGVTPCADSVALLNDSFFEDGDLTLTGAVEFKYDVSNSYIGSGFGNETGSDSTFIQRGAFNGVRSASSESRRGFRQFFVDATVLNETIATLPLGPTTLTWDSYKVRGFLRSQGNNKDRKIEVYLVNNTDVTEALIAEFTILAADALVNCELNTTFQPRSAGAAASVSLSRTDSGATETVVFRDTAYALGKSYSIRIDSVIGTGPGDEGNASWQLMDLRSWIESPVYNYG